ncbi:SusC/RagA family TonB-linked outer membrane protein [Flavivirga rizhaonensis]|uniref:TonB-dependent receptor n=1 Tax=Flavivirga rizhaonensis TaxID=2559571 RepID=A0A4S1DVI6_9FLAO|nr:TonB-dependent receptor [Flavivirga rizhaonensis]TGV02161.1 TonB-dependent receptor [Flavivirga rizhaonensis]
MEIKLTKSRFKKRFLIIVMKTFIFLLCTTVFSLSPKHVLSQNSKIVIEEDITVTVDEVFKIIKAQTSDYMFIYPEDLFRDFPKIQLKRGKIRLNKLLNMSLSLGDVNVIVTKNNTILIKEKSRNDKRQQKEVSGKVTDKNGLAVPGATVRIKGTNTGTATDFDGKYSITVPSPENVLVFSFLGYETQEIVVNDQTTINVLLNESVTSLDETVIIGYGSVKKQNLTGSVGVVDMVGITNQAPTVNLDNALQGQVAGVFVSSSSGQPGSAARVRIRGATSLFGSNQPLYVIDGIPVVATSNIPTGGSQGQSLGNELNQEGLSTPLGNINSADIESITVLKDASATAVYGSRAANGVIVINTKRGAYGEDPKFQANMSLSTQRPRTLEVLNAAQFREAWTTAVENGTVNNAYTQSVLDGSYFGDANTNWEDEVSPGSPITSNYNLSVQGGSQKTRFGLSLGANTQEGVFESTGFDRYTFNLNLDTKVNDKWLMGVKTNISFSEQKSLDPGITQTIYNYRPDIPVFDEDGNYSFSPMITRQNPVALSKGSNNNKTFLFLGSAFAQVILAEGLKFKTSFALNFNNGNQRSFYPKFTNVGGFDRRFGDGDGYAQESRNNSSNILWQNELSFDKSFNSHNLNAVALATFEKNSSSQVLAWGEGFENEILTNINSATIFTDGSSQQVGSGLISYIARVNYDFDEKYLLTLAGRVDGSSRFAPDNEYAFFPSVAGAWRLSEEPFLEDSEIVEDLKIRASYGIAGQQAFGPYPWRTLFIAEDYGPDPSVIPSQLGNNALKWETTRLFDLGLDFSLFKGRLYGSVAYFTKDTKDLLFNARPGVSTGFRSITANIGDTQNRGYELEIKADIIRSESFSWNLDLNITTLDNKLTKISDDFLRDDGYISGFGGGGLLRVGSPLGIIFGYEAEGLFQTQEEIDLLNAGSDTGVYQNARTSPGDVRFKDITGPDGVPDGRITNLDQTTIGNAQPDFFGGFNSTFRYKGFALSTFFNFSIGNEIEAFGLARDTNFASTFLGENKTTDVLNAWTPENPNTNVPRIIYFDPNNNDRTSSHYVYDGSYLRLKTLNFSYTFPDSVIKRLKFVDQVSLFFIAQNLLTITNYPGADPEATNLFNNDISAGRDNNRFPVAKVFTTGIRIGF